MALENWVLSLSRFKETVLHITDILLNRVTVESTIDDAGIEGAKAVWVGESGERTLEMNRAIASGQVHLRGELAPTIEYWQRGARRGVSVKHPKSLSIEFDERALENVETLKAAGTAVMTGAIAGLIGWLTLVIIGRATMVKAEQKDKSVLQIESDVDEDESNS